MHPEYGLDFRYQLYDDVAWIGAMDSTSPQTIQPMKECVADLLFAFFCCLFRRQQKQQQLSPCKSREYRASAFGSSLTIKISNPC